MLELRIVIAISKMLVCWLSVMLSRILIQFLLIMYLSAELLCGQVYESEGEPLHAFFDSDGIPIVTGYVVKFSKEQIVVRDGHGNEERISTRQLGKEDRKFLSNLEKTKVEGEKKNKLAVSLLKRAESSNGNSKIRTLKKIQALGRVVEPQTKKILAMLEEDADSDVRIAAYECFMSVCALDEENYQKALQLVQDDSQLQSQVSKNPAFWFPAIGQFGSIAEPILVSSAFEGNFVFTIDSDNEIKIGDTPQNIGGQNGPRRQIRATSAFALSQIPTTSAQHQTVALFTFAENPAKDGVDALTMKAIVSGWAAAGTYGISFSKYNQVRSRYAKVFPKEIASWKQCDELKKSRSELLDRLQEDSRMRNFYGANKEFLVRGSLLKVAGKEALIKTMTNGKVTLKLADFSSKDKKWINEHAD